MSCCQDHLPATSDPSSAKLHHPPEPYTVNLHQIEVEQDTKNRPQLVSLLMPFALQTHGAHIPAARLLRPLDNG